MKFEVKYGFGDIVYLVTDEDQSERMVREIKLIPGGVIYHLSKGEESSEHYEIEISDTKDMYKQLNLSKNESGKK